MSSLRVACDIYDAMLADPLIPDMHGEWSVGVRGPSLLALARSTAGMGVYLVEVGDLMSTIVYDGRVVVVDEEADDTRCPIPAVHRELMEIWVRVITDRLS